VSVLRFVLIFFVLISNTQCAKALDVQKLINSTSNLKLTQDIIIDKKIIVPPKFTMNGNRNKIIFKQNGSFVLKNPKDVIFDNVHILIKGKKPLSGALFDISDSKGFVFKNSVVNVDINHKSEKKEMIQKVGTASPLGKIISVFYFPNTNNESITIENNEFTASSMYTVKLVTQALTAKHKIAFEPKFSKVIFRNNKILRFHGGAYLYNCADCIFTKNFFKKVSLGNLVISGENILVEDNIFTLSGAGGAGDAISIPYPVKNLDVISNSITYAHCYGLWFTYSAEDVLFKNNTVVGGYTTALNFENSKKRAKEATFKNIRIESNTFYNNRGWGLHAVGTDGLKIKNNLFFKDKFLIRKHKSYVNKNIDIQGNMFTELEHKLLPYMPNLTEYPGERW
jgi:parallel beta-helix repeat protein